MTKHKRPETTLNATVTFLAMDARPTGPGPSRPSIKTAILRAENPPAHFYRYLYDTIGSPYFWIERRTWTDASLAALLSAPEVALYVLYAAGVPAGIAELDFRETGSGQLVYFGLTPDFVGRRIGPWFLHQTVELAWAQPITRLLVSTCTLDHKKALSTYQRAGFEAYARSQKTVAVPAEFPTPLPRH